MASNDDKGRALVENCRRSIEEEDHAYQSQSEQQQPYSDPIPQCATSQCRHSRSALQKLLAESAFGTNSAMFETFFYRKGGHGPPLCRRCAGAIGEHADVVGSPMADPNSEYGPTPQPHAQPFSPHMDSYPPQDDGFNPLFPPGASSPLAPMQPSQQPQNKRWRRGESFRGGTFQLGGGGGGGGPPGTAQYGIAPMDQPYGNLDQPAAVRHVHGKASQGMNAMEVGMSFLAWLLVLGLWVHLFFFTPVCELEWERNLDYCTSYYGSQSVGTHRWYFWLVFGLLYVFYLAQSWFSPVGQYLRHTVCRNLDTYIAAIKAAPPNLWWSIQCYHYETRTETYTDSDGNTQTRDVQERVDTHSATGSFHFDSFRDLSPPVEVPVSTKATRIRGTKAYSFADAKTQNLYEMEFASFVQMNDRDTHKSVSSRITVDGFETFVLFIGEGNRKPFLFSSLWYWVFNIFLLGPLYRVYFYCVTVSTDFNCVKEVQR